MTGICTDVVDGRAIDFWANRVVEDAKFNLSSGGAVGSLRLKKLRLDASLCFVKQFVQAGRPVDRTLGASIHPIKIEHCITGCHSEPSAPWVRNCIFGLGK